MAVMDELKFDSKGLIPAIAQDEKTKDVLMIAYMNKESLERTLKEGKACYWRVKQKVLGERRDFRPFPAR